MRPSGFSRGLRAATMSLSLALAACATGPAPGGEVDPYQVNDPIEPVNRAIFSGNEALDLYIIRPVAQVYHDYIPVPVQSSVRNFLNNLHEPIVFANDLLQGRPAAAGNDLARLAINTTFGLGGLLDITAPGGNTYHDADFGQTFGVWGVPDGPYLVLPIFGPSNPRDTVGLIAGFYADPADAVAEANNYYLPVIARGVTDGIDTRSRYLSTLDRIKSTSLDYYATIRSLSRQRRAAEIRHEETNALAPDFSPQQGPK
jgi:phospholipid-binding lipoprotein MlaA